VSLVRGRVFGLRWKENKKSPGGSAAEEDPRKPEGLSAFQ